MNTHRIYTLLLLCLFFVACQVEEKQTTPIPDSPEAPPNVLLISIDTLRADHLGSYGYERDTSPFLDELANRGVRFANAFVNTHGTTPSHTTILSSLYQETHRVSHSGSELDKIPQDVRLLQEIYQQQGYTTIGVTGGGNVGGKFGFSRGFDRFNDRMRSAETGVDKFLAILEEESTAKGPQAEPIFAFFHTYEVHSPYAPPEEFRRFFDVAANDFDPTSENLLAIAHQADSLGPEGLQYLLDLYDAGIRHTDAEMARLFARLEEVGFLENAIIVITSDHGEEFGEHGGLLHRGLLYDELLKVPMIFLGRSIPEEVVSQDFVSSVDIAPTLLACSGISIPEEMQGGPLFCSSSSKEERDEIIAQYGPDTTIRGERWKYIEIVEPQQVELYDLSQDPGETEDVHKENRRILAQLRERATHWRESRQTVSAAESIELSREEIKQLEALGYLAGGKEKKD